MKEVVAKLQVLCLLVCFMLACNTLALSRQVSTIRDREQITPSEAMDRYEKLFEATTEPQLRFYLATKLAPTALAAGETEKAKTYARSLIQQAAAYEDNWNYGNAIEVGNLVLGLISLNAGDVTEAKRYLLEAGNTPGSPQLNSFGPNMRLAKELLARGEREVVIQYFGLCGKFWKFHQERLDNWKEIVIKGGTPNFGANLDYRLSVWRVENWAKLQP
jgi:hypothetical protein